MDMKLNVYHNGQVEKTYTAETYDLMLGTVEDIVAIIDLDAFTSDKNTDFIAAVGKLIVKGFNQFKPLLKDIFPGLTDDELRRVKTSEVVPVIMNVIKFTVQESFVFGKNK